MEISNERDRHRFVGRLPEGEGQLLYRDAGPGVINLWHTEVDPALRGKGVANALALAAFEYARAHSMRVMTTCPFVQGWLKRHPEQLDIVAASPPRPS